MADDFDGLTVLSESEADSFFNPGTVGRGGAVSETEVREAIYSEEIAEIARLRESLKLNRLAGQRMTEDARRKGNQILDARLRQAEARREVDPIPEYVPPVEPESTKPGRGRWRDSPRQDARRQGLIHYTSDRPCFRGHESRRYVSTGQCLVCLLTWTAKKRAKLLANDSQD